MLDNPVLIAKARQLGPRGRYRPKTHVSDLCARLLKVTPSSLAQNKTKPKNKNIELDFKSY